MLHTVRSVVLYFPIYALPSVAFIKGKEGEEGEGGKDCRGKDNITFQNAKIRNFPTYTDGLFFA